MMITAQLKKKTSPIHVVFVLSILLLPLLILFTQKHQTAYANSTPSLEKTSSSKVMITASDLNVRNMGDISGHIIGVVHRGETFEMIQTKNKWDQIKLSPNQTGWVNNAYVTTKVNEEEDQPATVDAVVLNVREHPSLSSDIVGQLKLGSQITIHEESAGWVYDYYISKNARSTHRSSSITGALKTNVKLIDPSQTTNNGSMGQSPARLSRSSGIHMAVQSVKTWLTQTRLEPLRGKTIVLDPGHGGKDDGTTSPFTGTHEKTLTLATAKVVEAKLEDAGAHVIMTRTTDTFIPLQQRADISNQNHADAFISFHYNDSSDPSANGLVDFHYQNSQDTLLATDILNAVVKSTGLQNDGTRYDNLDVLRNNSQPCTLIELGFLSNQQDNSFVESSNYRNKVAQGVLNGLIDYFSNDK
jgi:N-acetylmuramoyl-L-alanine amidase